MEIYKIINTVNGYSYVGLTTKTAVIRFKKHLFEARNGNHRYLYNSIRKYGAGKFELGVLEKNITDINDLKIREIYWIEQLKPEYNNTKGGQGTTGYKFTDEERQKISTALKGKKFSAEHRLNMSLVRRGKTSCRKGKNITEKHKEQIRLYWKNRREARSQF